MSILKPRKFRMSDEDVALLDALAEKFTEMYAIKAHRSDALRKAIRELADRHLTEEERSNALEHLQK